ncbi:hypothetical protein PIB30_028601 [Stylosanthes scabra]|uniref:DUF674 family protein n=1 Tax=Stylosanthes scabra TaxID=79078 RepID=A0ABU6XAN0_9FABA|nr:hypothetical protein [Stylosanthes scabra]
MSSSSRSTKAENQVRLKLLIHKEKNIVIYAEAGKDFVDSLFSFLTLPLGHIVRLAGEESNIPAVRVGCLTTLYQSVAKLHNECLRNEICKDMLLHPRNMPMELYRQKLKLNVSRSEALNYFSSSDACSCLSAFKNVSCFCGSLTSYRSITASSGEYENGFVKENNFIICDDLYVMPNAISNSLPLLQKHGVQNINHVLEKTVIVSKKELLDLLKCSLLSKTPLTDAFLLKKCAIPDMHGCYPELPELDIRQLPNDSGINFDVNVILSKSNKKVLMVQAEEDFANFILSFLTYPLGGLLNILQRSPSSSCLEQLNKSLHFLLREDKYFTSHYLQDLLAHPPCTYIGYKADNGTLVITTYLASMLYDPFYYKFNAHVSSSYYRRIEFEGFVKGPCKFTVTDDLVVNQMFSGACLSFINGADASAISDLEQRTLRIGLKECFSILKASFSHSALTNGLLRHLETTIKQEKKP